jgi:hypothetical protein
MIDTALRTTETLLDPDVIDNIREFYRKDDEDYKR